MSAKYWAGAELLDREPAIAQEYHDHWSNCKITANHCYICNIYTRSDHYKENYLMPFTSYPKPKPAPAPGIKFKSAISACPYEESTTTFILFRDSDVENSLTSAFIGGVLNEHGRFIKDRDQKIKALLEFRPGFDLLLVCWPGQYSQDIFRITTSEERDKALARFGLKKRSASPPKTFTAQDGTVYETGL